MFNEHALVSVFYALLTTLSPNPLVRNTQIINTCIIFRQWHITSRTAFVLSLIVIAGLGVLFEYLRVAQRTFDARIALSLARHKSGRSRSPSPAIASGSEAEIAESERLLGTRRSPRRDGRGHAL